MFRGALNASEVMPLSWLGASSLPAALASQATMSQQAAAVNNPREISWNSQQPEENQLKLTTT